MIKICKYLYIHPTTVILFVICYITRQLEILSICYIIMLIHELAHLLAALLIGLIPSKIIIYPFGINLKLKNTLVYSLADEIILYAAGPLSNILMALISIPFINSFQYTKVFYIQNIALFILNLLPINPLDGGVILKKILMYFYGNKTSTKILNTISTILIISLTTLLIYLTINYSFNYSIFFLSIFLLCTIFTSHEKYNIDFIKELMFYKEKGKFYNNQKVKIIISNNNESPVKIAEFFSTGSYYIVFLINDKGKITEILTETEILKKLVKH